MNRCIRPWASLGSVGVADASLADAWFAAAGLATNSRLLRAGRAAGSSSAGSARAARCTFWPCAARYQHLRCVARSVRKYQWLPSGAVEFGEAMQVSVVAALPGVADNVTAESATSRSANTARTIGDVCCDMRLSVTCRTLQHPRSKPRDAVQCRRR